MVLKTKGQGFEPRLGAKRFQVSLYLILSYYHTEIVETT